MSASSSSSASAMAAAAAASASASSSSGSSSAASSASSAPSSTSSDAAQPISLKVRTLDHKTYHINILRDASVPQLKEIIQVETGVVIPRQRLIFRGKVLKNDQNISAYSLEDGHTLHLVVRAENAVNANTGVAASTTSSSSSSSLNDASPPSASAAATSAGGASASNSSADDNAGMAPSRVLMGATITVPEGSEVSMPFLSSMIANFVSSVAGTAFVAGEPSDSNPVATATANANTSGSQRPPNAQRIAASMIPNARVGSNANAPEPRSASVRIRRRVQPTIPPMTSGAAAPTPGAASVRRLSYQRLDDHLRILETNLNNWQTDPVAQQSSDAQMDDELAHLQTQVTRLSGLLTRFNQRLVSFPGMLRDLRSAAPGDRTNLATFQTTVQQLAGALETVGRISRLGTGSLPRSGGSGGGSLAGPRVTISDNGRVRASFSSSFSIPVLNHPGSTTSLSAIQGAGSSLARQSTNDNSSEGERPPVRARIFSSGSFAGASSENPQQRHHAFLDRLDRIRAGLSSAVPDSGSSSPGVYSEVALDPSGTTSSEAASAGSGSSARSSTSVEPPSPYSSSGFPPNFSLAGTARFSVPLNPSNGFSMGFPSFMMPVPLASTVTTWNLPELFNRLITSIPSPVLYGLMTGNPEAVQSIMASVGRAIASGVDVPMVNRSSIRNWSNDFMADVRTQLINLGLPIRVSRSLRGVMLNEQFVDNLVNPLSPFIPDLVDHVVRATSVTRTAAFGQTCIVFLRRMAQAFVESLRLMVNDSVEGGVNAVMESLLVHYGLEPGFARFVVDTFMRWSQVQPMLPSSSSSSSAASAVPRTTNSRRRSRDDSDADADALVQDGGSTKRVRRE